MKILLAIKKHFTTRTLECYGKLTSLILLNSENNSLGAFSIIMEYADGGDIFTLIKDHQKQ